MQKAKEWLMSGFCRVKDPTIDLTKKTDVEEICVVLGMKKHLFTGE